MASARGREAGGLVVVVDSNRPVKQHGIPPARLRCEFAALGMEPVKFSMLPGGEAYLKAFRIARTKAGARADRALQGLEVAELPELVQSFPAKTR